MDEQIDVKKEDPRIGEFAILCRKVRLYMAKNPGCMVSEMRNHFGGKRCQMAIGKMVNMGIVRSEWTPTKEGGRITRWYVVPQ